MSGGKGGSSTSQTQIPDWIAEPAQRNIARAEAAQQIGYIPYTGPEVAAFSPTEQALMQSRSQTAQMLGILPQGSDAMAGMPQAQEFAGGIQGYSSLPLYEQAAQEVAQRSPGQMGRYGELFVDPATGDPARNFTQALNDQAGVTAQSGQSGFSGGDGGGRDPVTGQPSDYTGSQFGRDIGFGLYGMPLSPISNMVGAAMLDNEIAAIDSTYDDLPVTRGGDNNGGGFADDSDPGGGTFGSPSGWD